MLSDLFRVFAERSRGRGFTDGLDPDVFGTSSGMIAVSFDARSYLERKFSALAAHRSVFGLTQEMLLSPTPGVAQMLDAFRPAFEREDFVLAGTRVATASWPLQDFFDGLETAELTRMTSEAARARHLERAGSPRHFIGRPRGQELDRIREAFQKND